MEYNINIKTNTECKFFSFKRERQEQRERQECWLLKRPVSSYSLLVRRTRMVAFRPLAMC